MDKIKVFLVDDHQIVRDGIKSLLQSEGDIIVIAEAASYEELNLKINESVPDILILDISLPDISGIEICKIISAKYPEIKVIILSMHTGEEFIYKALSAGAKGYLPKNITKKELLRAVRKIIEGGEYFSEEVSDVIMKSYIRKAKGGPSEESPDQKLSGRELEILRLYAEGYTNKEIADMLFISPRTVESHKNHIMQKLDLKTNVDLIKFAIKNKYIEL